jgi:uncharacterized damage-inducible protein DinB
MNTIKKYTNFNFWANELLLSVTENEVTEESLDKVIQSSFPSLRKTIYHIWDAEYIWLKRLSGESLSDWPSKSFKGDFSEAKEKMLLNSKAFISYAEKLSDAELNSPFTYKNVEGKEFTNQVWESIHHCMNHSTYHRGQMVTLLRQLGVATVPSTDFITYCRTVK